MRTHPTNVALGDSVTLVTPNDSFSGIVRGLEPAGVILVDPHNPARTKTVEWDTISDVRILEREGWPRQTARDTVPNSVLPAHLQRQPRK